MNKELKKFKGKLNTCYYTEDGFGMPEFNTLKAAFNFNEYYNLYSDAKEN